MRFTVLLAFLISVSALAADPTPDNAIQEKPSSVPQAVLNVGVETAGSVTDGQFSVLVPLQSTIGDSGVLGGSLVFAEPYATWIERGAAEAGLGLGVRHLFSNQPVSALKEASSHVAGFLEEGFYVGADLSFDMLQRSDDVRYWQMALGAEVGTRYLELRGHYYLPVTSGETTQYNHTSTFHDSINTFVGSDHVIAHTVTRLHSSYSVQHESLEGWDLETAALVPWVDQWMDLKLVGGFASFHSTSLDAIQYDSWKAGVELRPVPVCVLSATWYANDKLVGDHWMYGIRLELPFETADIGDGKGGFWGHIKDGFKSRRRHLAERLFESAHARHIEPQVANYVTDASLDVRSRTRGAVILPDGTVLPIHENSTLKVRQTVAGSSSAGISATSSSGTSSVSFSSDTTYAGLTVVAIAPVANSTSTTTSSGTTNATNTPSTSTGGVVNVFDWTTIGVTSSTNFGVVTGSGVPIDTSLFSTVDLNFPPSADPIPVQPGPPSPGTKIISIEAPGGHR